MKICHAFIFFSIKFAGGTSDLMYKICKAQAKIGHEPIVFTGHYQFDQELAASLSGTKFKIIKSFFDKLGFSIMPALIPICKKELKQYDVVHMHVFRTFQNAILYYYCRKYKIPYVIDAHGAVPYYKNKNFVKKIFDRFLGKKMLRNAACLIAETQVGVDEYLAIDPSLDQEKITILSPPFDTDEFQSLPEFGHFRQKYNLQSKKIITFLGRIHHIKGIDFLIKGFAKLARKRDDVCLVVVGSDDGHLSELQNLVRQLNLQDKVIFAGFMAGNDKLSALVDADIVAQTSRHEQGAWAPFEAVLCGTPIIVTAHTGAGEDVKRINAGYLADFDDEEGLANKINYILANYQEAKTKTLKAKQFIEDNLSMNTRVSEYIDIYKKCIKNAKSPNYN